MKRVKAGCIMQTLVFSQKPENAYTREQTLRINREEVQHYKETLEKTKVRYIIVDEQEQQDGSIIVHVKKQYNGKAEVEEYFQ